MLEEDDDTTILSKIIDSDNDGLDDRLIEGNSKTASIRDILNRIEHLHIENIPEKILLRMQSNLEEKKNHFLTEAKKLEQALHILLLQGDYHALAETRKSLRWYKQQTDELSSEQQHIEHCLQEKRMHQRLDTVLSPKGHRILNWTSIILTIFVLILLVIDFQNTPTDTHALNSWNIFLIDSACCLFFISEFILRYRAADNKRWFLKNHWIDLLTSIPIPPADTSRLLRLGRSIRILKLIRVLRLFRLLKILRAMLFLSKTITRVQDILDVKTMKRSLQWAVSIIIVGAIVITKLEGSSSNNAVSTLHDSLWWSFSTVVTGGYADLYNPISIGGQLITSMLVIAGMIFVGVFTATLTSMYVGEDASELEHQNDELFIRVTKLEEKINQMHEQLFTQQFNSTEKTACQSENDVVD